MIRSLLVPLDGSPFGEQALPLALALTRGAHAALQMVHVHVPIASAYSGNELAANLYLDAEMRLHERDYLRRVTDRVAGEEPGQVTSALLEGPVVEALREHMLSHGTDLVVMTTHGRGPFTRFWLGSVVDQMIRQLPVPVLLVRPRDNGAARVVPRHLLVPLDGSPLAEQVLTPALEVARTLAADVALLRVVEMPSEGRPAGLDPAMLRRCEVEARGYLEEVAGRLRESGVRVTTRVVVDRRPAAAILEAAEAHDGTLIALATHGRGGLARLLLGSVADKVIRGATAPVLVYRPLSP
jgi:nucleotide-binding universal stress UspA family protein